MYDNVAQNAFEYAMSLLEKAKSGAIEKNGVVIDKITWKELRKEIDAHIKQHIHFDRGRATEILTAYPRILSYMPQAGNIQDALNNALALEIMAPYRQRLTEALSEQFEEINTDDIESTFNDALQVYNALPKQTIFADPKLDQRNVFSLVDHLDGEIKDEDLKPQGKISHFFETAYSYAVDLEQRMRDRTPEAKRHARRLLELGDFLRMCAEDPQLVKSIKPSVIAHQKEEQANGRTLYTG